MRCPDCNKFVSYDEPQVTLNDVSVDDDTVTASASVALNCQDCGCELKTAEIEAQATIEHACDKAVAEGEEQYEIETDGEPEGTSRVQTVDRHGRKIRSARYMKTYYGFELATEVKCNGCKEQFTVNVSADEQASAFEECC